MQSHSFIIYEDMKEENISNYPNHLYQESFEENNVEFNSYPAKQYQQ